MSRLVNKQVFRIYTVSQSSLFFPPIGEFFIHPFTGQLCDVQYDKPFQTVVCKVLSHKCWCARHPLNEFSDGDYDARFLNTKASS